MSNVTNPVTLTSLASATLVWLAFCGALFAGAKLLPGKMVDGFPQPTGQRQRYKINGTALWIATHVFVVVGTLAFDLSLATLIHEFWSYFVVANVTAVIVTLVLHRQGRKHGDATDHSNGNSKVWTDLWYGAELNPKWLGVDLKTFAYQPSLVGLWLLNLAFAYVQYEQLGRLTPQMVAYQVFWWLYMTTHFHFEAGILSMWDIIAERFGFMLIWGDLVLVPFFYCIPGWWLLRSDHAFSPLALAALAILHVAGLWIFRGANAQKDRFKRNPHTTIWGRPAEALGNRLLVSGWWGFGRKINYTGEILVYVSFSACTGMQSFVPYLLPLWLCVLLPHRAWRDEQRCRQKYGELWDAYTRRARFRMIPFVY